MRKLVIVPAYNEQENISRLLQKLQKISDFDVVVVNDCSQDTTYEICLENGVKVLNLPTNLGIGGAVQTGYKYAVQNNYDIAIQVDGDGQHDPQYLNFLIEPLMNQESDMVIGSRFINKQGFQSLMLRRFGIRFFSILIKIITRNRITDPTSGFRACNKEIIHYFAENYPSDYPEPESIVAVSRLGYRIKEQPIIMHERLGGVSSIRKLRTIYYMVKVTLAILIDSIKKEDKLVPILKIKANKKHRKLLEHSYD